MTPSRFERAVALSALFAATYGVSTPAMTCRDAECWKRAKALATSNLYPKGQGVGADAEGLIYSRAITAMGTTSASATPMTESAWTQFLTDLRIAS